MPRAYLQDPEGRAGGGGGGGGLSLESRVKFPYIHESRNFLEPLLVTMNV